MVDKAITDSVSVWEILPGNSTPNLFDEIHISEDLFLDNRTFVHPRPFTARVLNNFKSYANIQDEI